MRTKENRYVPYEVARSIIQNVTPRVTTRTQYWRWHERTNPYYMPKRPDRMKKWKCDFSWNDYLNTNNSFEKTLARNKGGKRVYRNYWDAVRWAQQLAKDHNITTQKDWRAYIKDNALPDDIPRRPEREYDNFSWFTWLGKNIESKVVTEQNTVRIVGLHHVSGMNSNVVNIRIHKGEVSEESGKLYQGWEMEDNTVEWVEKGLDMYGSRVEEGWIVSNVHQVLWYLNMEVQLKMV